MTQTGDGKSFGRGRELQIAKVMSKNKDQKVKDLEKEIIDQEETVITDENTESAKEVEEEISLEEKLQKEIEELKNQNLRIYAEFENYKKRTSKERIELFGTANQELMSALLPVMDDFQRALKNLEGNEAKDGVGLIFNKFDNTLKNKGLKAMESSTGKEFSVDTMEAITRIPAPDKSMKGKVVDEIEAGYELGGKILRYAKVVVGE